MTTHFWADKYPANVNHLVNFDQYSTIIDVFENSVKKFADKPAFSNLGHSVSFSELDRLSAQFAAYLQQHTELKPGDRIAVQMPNLLQFPVVVFGALRAGLVVVNTNPLYTAREMEHQFNDSGAKALVAMANFGNLVQEVLPKTNIKHVIITEAADILPAPKRLLVNSIVKHVKKMVPKHDIPHAVKLTQALRLGKKARFNAAHTPAAEDIAVLQYTGGTTGVAKGAMLTHRNIVSNMMQMRSMLTDIREGQEVMITPLPLYHIFSFTVNCMAMLEMGCHSVLITNPRDIPGFIKELKKWDFTAMTGLNTLFVALMNADGFHSIDFSKLRLTIAGGMALQTAVAEKWKGITGCDICEGYGMTECSPVATVNPYQAIQLGTIGLPLPGTQLKVVDDDGNLLPFGEAGELCILGPQVMKGYWQRPDATNETLVDGWLKTGDVAVIQPDGYVRIVDRKKDMILVSGFNVYPNEIEEVVAKLPGVLECAAVGVPDEKSGEAVKIFVVKGNPGLTEQQIREHCKHNLTGYKLPKYIEFRTELPKTNVGKILRRELRDSPQRKVAAEALETC